MLFTTDKQTQEDLNIYGKHGTDSILSLFNCTATVHGSKLLEEMFRYPLSDAEKINTRSAKISYLKMIRAVFPFGSERFDQAEQYLAITDERTKLSAEKPTLEKKLSSLVGVDADYKQITSGVSALTEIFQQLHILLNSNLLIAGSPLRNDPETQHVQTLLTTEPIHSILQENPKVKLPHEKLAGYDTQLR
jgi:DNA mismatch repair protein MutS